MKTKTEKVTPEWIFLESCVSRFGSTNDVSSLYNMLSSVELDWGELLYQAVRHNLLPLLSYTLQNNKISEKVPNGVLRMLGQSLLFNRHTLQLGYGEIASITKAFEAESIPFVVTKGYVFDSLLYQSVGIRQTNDIDLILSPKDKFKAAEILKKLGYQPGHFDHKTEEVVEANEQIKKFFHVVAEYSPEFVKKLHDPVIQAFYVDMNFSLTWLNSSYRIPVEQALKSAIRIEIPGYDVTMPILSPDYQIIYTALHLFKEAWVESFGIKDGNDVNLTKFMDMYFLLSDQFDKIELANFLALLTEHQLLKPVQWVIVHTQRVFGCSFLEKWGIHEPVSETWLSSWQSKDYKIQYWKGTMRERLQKKNRVDLFLT